MNMPKFTTDEIKADLAALEQGGFKCAVYYLKAELTRRKRSGMNAGRPPKYEDDKHKRNAKAAADYRERRKAK